MISQNDLQQYKIEGYCIIKNAIPSDELTILDASCESYIDHIHSVMDRNGSDTMGISHRNKRYFISNKHKELNLTELKKFLFSELMANIAQTLIGDNVYLFHEQFVVKSADRGMKFSWHQDSGYIGHDHTPYLTCWIPLIDVNENNGTVYVLPYSLAKTKDISPHFAEKGSNDLVGYTGDQKGIPVEINRGDLVCFSSTTFHRSSENKSKEMRPAYIVQYSPDVIKNKIGDKPCAFADPLVINGNYCSHHTMNA